MKVIITETASDSLWPIFERHLEYSEEYAVNFQQEIEDYMRERLSTHDPVSVGQCVEVSALRHSVGEHPN